MLCQCAPTKRGLEVYALQQRRGRVGRQLETLALGGLALVLQVGGRVRVLCLGPARELSCQAARHAAAGPYITRVGHTWLI